MVADARDRGGRVVAGGERPAGAQCRVLLRADGAAGVPTTPGRLRRGEFRPDRRDHALRGRRGCLWARQCRASTGLSAYVFTRDPGRVREAVAALEAGMVGVNSFALAAAEAPFGGIKESGMGREGGTEGILDYLNVKLAQITV